MFLQLLIRKRSLQDIVPASTFQARGVDKGVDFADSMCVVEAADETCSVAEADSEGGCGGGVVDGDGWDGFSCG